MPELPDVEVFRRYFESTSMGKTIESVARQPELQGRLHRDDSATIYVSDVLPGHRLFEAVQWWGTLGGLHGIVPVPGKRTPRGANIHGQYYEAAPFHKVELNRLLDGELELRWRKRAEMAEIPVDQLPRVGDRTTRGDFIEAAYAARSSH